MDALSWTIYRYKVAIPYRREGLLVSLTHPSGEEKWADIAPLPNWSSETLEQALIQLKTLLPELVQTASLPASLLPSVSFGLESALSSTQHTHTSVPIAGFLQGTSQQMIEKGKTLIKQGYTTAKIKIASLPMQEALHVVESLKDSLRLRIDLNRAWSRTQTEHFFCHFSPADFDYIEEPVDRLEELLTFPYPLALDESLHQISLEMLEHIPHLRALVIKPTLHGGFSRWAHLVQFAKERNLNLVLGGAYESGIGIAQIARLITTHQLPVYPLGIDTYRYLEQDILETPLDFSTGVLTLPQTFSLNYNLLEKIAHG